MPPGQTTRAISATPLAGSGHEEDHQRHDRCVERVVGERQCHRIALTKLRDTRRGSRASERELRLGRIDPVDRGGRAALDEHFSKGAVAAADVEPSQSGCWSQPVEERLAGELAPRPHVSFVGSPIVEADLVGHVSPGASRYHPGVTTLVRSPRRHDDDPDGLRSRVVELEAMLERTPRRFARAKAGARRVRRRLPSKGRHAARAAREARARDCGGRAGRDLETAGERRRRPERAARRRTARAAAAAARQTPSASCFATSPRRFIPTSPATRRRGIGVTPS